MGTRGIPWPFLAGAAAVGLALRLAFGLGYWVDRPLTRDEIEYLSLARSLAHGDGFVFDAAVREGTVEPFGRAPGYPFVLAFIGGGGAVPAAVPTAVKVVQAAAGAAGVVLVGLFAWKLAGTGAARAASAIAAGYPPLVWMAAYALSEALFWPLGLAAAWLLDRAIDARDPQARLLGVMAGAGLGVASLCRAGTVLMIVLTGLFLLWRRRPALLVAIGVGAAVVIGPWTARNYVHYGRFVLVATEGGVTFWTGNNALASGEGDQAANPSLKIASAALKAAHPEARDEEALEPVYYREAMHWIRSHPIDWLVLETKKLFYLLVPIGPSYRMHSRLYLWGSIGPYALALPFAIVGAWRLRGRFSRTPGLWLLAGSVVAVCLVFFPQERFRFPLIDSALVVCAAVAFGGVREERAS